MARSQTIFTLRFAAASFICAVGIFVVAYAAHAQIAGVSKTVKPNLAAEEQKFVARFVAERDNLQQQLETAKALGDAQRERRIVQQLGKLVSDANKAYRRAVPDENAVDFCEEPPGGEGVCHQWGYHCENTAGLGDSPRYEVCTTAGQLPGGASPGVDSGAKICGPSAVYQEPTCSRCAVTCGPNGETRKSSALNCHFEGGGAGAGVTVKVIGTGKGIGKDTGALNLAKNSPGKKVTLPTGETLAYNPKTNKFILSGSGMKSTSFAQPKRVGTGGIVVPLTSAVTPPTQPPAGAPAALPDWGDGAPDATLTLAGDNGPYVPVSRNLKLGQNVNGEADANVTDRDGDDGLQITPDGIAHLAVFANVSRAYLTVDQFGGKTAVRRLIANRIVRTGDVTIGRLPQNSWVRIYLTNTAVRGPAQSAVGAPPKGKVGNAGEIEDWYITPAPIPYQGESAPGTPAPASGKEGGALSPSSRVPAPSFLGWLSHAFGF